MIMPPLKCLVHRIWPRIEECPAKEQVEEFAVSCTKVNTKNNRGEYVAE